MWKRSGYCFFNPFLNFLLPATSHIDLASICMNKRIRSLLYFGLAVVVLVVAGYYVYRYVVSPPPEMNRTPSGNTGNTGGGRGGGGRALPVSVYIADYDNISDGYVCSGALWPNEVVDLACQTTGKVVLINFKEGERVEKGTLLVKIDDLDLKAQLTRAEHQFALASEKLERQRILFEKEAVSREAFDQALTDYNMIMADMELLKVRIDRTEIRAPFSGVIGFRTISLGAYLQAGSKVATLTDIATLKLEFYVPQKDIFKRLEGATALFTVMGSEKGFRAKVYAIDPVLEGKTRTIGLRAIYDNRDGMLWPGMIARVMINPEHTTASLLVPSEAVIPDVDGRTVWLVRKNRAVQVPVKTGNRTADKVEILDGVSRGDTVITSGLLQIRQNQPVEAVIF